MVRQMTKVMAPMAIVLAIGIASTTALGAQAISFSSVATTRRLSQQPRELPALLEVHSHAEKVRRGSRDDLRESGRVHRIVSGDYVLSPRAFEQDDCLDHVSVDPGACGRVIHQGAEARCALR